MIELYHVSDLHIKKADGSAHSLLTKLSEEFKSNKNPDKYLLVTGDTVDKGIQKYYECALQDLLLFKDKLIIIPGNHEYGSWFFPTGFFYSKKSAKYFDEFISSQLDIKHDYFNKKPFGKVIEDSRNKKNKVLIVGLNSSNQNDAFGSCGVIGETQRNEFDWMLKNAVSPEIPKIVLLHHIPNHPAREFYMHLVDWKKVWEILRLNRVNVVAHGHQGKMDDIRTMIQLVKYFFVKIFLNLRTKNDSDNREMEIKEIDGIKVLDANHSVKDMACYHIKIDYGEDIKKPFVSISKMKL